MMNRDKAPNELPWTQLSGISDSVMLPVSQGWQCPVCRAVFSPLTPRCLNCTGIVRDASASGVTAGCPGCRKSPCDHSSTACPMWPNGTCVVGGVGSSQMKITVKPCGTCGAFYCSHAIFDPANVQLTTPLETVRY